MLSGLLCQVLDLARWAVLIWVVLSWIPAPTGHPLRSVKDLFDRMLNPLLRPFRSLIPPVRAGTVGVDLSPLALFVAIYILQRIVC